MICAAWEAAGKPEPKTRLLNKLAKDFYPAEFAKSESDYKLRKNLQNRVLGTILRHKARAATKSPSIP